jgi:hypothetical protein
MAGKFIAGFNQPGYLPDNDPEEFDTFEEARDYLADELDRAADDATEGGDLADALEESADEIREETGPFSYLAADGYAYWVTEE